jgi:hypothetical protein
MELQRDDRFGRVKAWPPRVPIGVGLFLAVLIATTQEEASANSRVFRAGAAAVDVSPTTFPVIVSGMFLEREATRLSDPVMSRALVLDDGRTRLAIVVVDSLMLSRELLDRSKEIAAEQTGIPTTRMLISATHTHSAPSAMGALGSRADPAYQRMLPTRIAKSIEIAAGRLQPAKIGWAVVQDPRHNHCRRWIYRPDRLQENPFGERTVRAHMHPPHQSPDHIGPAGPADTDLTLLSLQTADGEPLAVLANYAMHYFGSAPVSADFCGRFGGSFAKRIDAQQSDPPFIGIMSQGTSGDSMWPDYSRPRRNITIEEYTSEIAEIAGAAYRTIEYRDWVPLGMAEASLQLGRRTPDTARLQWAQAVLAQMTEEQPRSKDEVYAREQLFLHDQPQVEIRLQAVRIGELGITAIPNEVYGVTGLKLKAQSPLAPTFNIELANGAQGYIPPPEQHALGGYTTWPARSAGLEISAEPKIVETLLRLLESVSGKPRQPATDPVHRYAAAVLSSRPAGYWRLGEMAGTRATDAVGDRHGSYEPGVALYLPGPDGPGFIAGSRGNRAAHFAGGCVKVPQIEPRDTYSVEFWFWNGLPNTARALTGLLFSWGANEQAQVAGTRLGIGGSAGQEQAGRLFVATAGDAGTMLSGSTILRPRTWQHVVLVKTGRRIRVHLNGNPEPELSGELKHADTLDPRGIVLAGTAGTDVSATRFEGKLDEFAYYDRALQPEELRVHYFAATRDPGQDDNRPNDSR